MAPLTRMRATSPGDVPNALMAEYYVQRAGAGLLISEGTQVSPEGKGYMDTPGIHSDEQVAGWRTVTDAVHEAGGLIAAQLWHVGRVSHESFHDGELPVSASAAALPQPHDRRAARTAAPPASAARPHGRWPWRRSRASSRTTAGPPSTPARPASTSSRSTAPTATCCTSSSPPTPTSARTSTAGRCRPRPADARGHRRGRRRLVRGPRGDPDLPASAPSTAPRTPRVPKRGCTSPASWAAATWPSCTSPSPTGPADRSSTTTTARGLRAAHPGPIVGAGNYDLTRPTACSRLA